MSVDHQFVPKLNRNAFALLDALMAGRDVKPAPGNEMGAHTNIGAVAPITGDEGDIQPAMELLAKALIKVPLKAGDKPILITMSKGGVFARRPGRINANIHFTLEGAPEAVLAHLQEHQDGIRAFLASAKPSRPVHTVEDMNRANALMLYESLTGSAAADYGVQEMDGQKYGIIATAAKLKANRTTEITMAVDTLIEALTKAGLHNMEMDFDGEEMQRSKEGRRNVLTVPLFLFQKDAEPAAMTEALKAKDTEIRDRLGAALPAVRELRPSPGGTNR